MLHNNQLLNRMNGLKTDESNNKILNTLKPVTFACDAHIKFCTAFLDLNLYMILCRASLLPPLKYVLYCMYLMCVITIWHLFQLWQKYIMMFYISSHV